MVDGRLIYIGSPEYGEFAPGFTTWPGLLGGSSGTSPAHTKEYVWSHSSSQSF